MEIEPGTQIALPEAPVTEEYADEVMFGPRRELEGREIGKESVAVEAEKVIDADDTETLDDGSGSGKRAVRKRGVCRWAPIGMKRTDVVANVQELGWRNVEREPLRLQRCRLRGYRALERRATSLKQR